MSTEWWQILIVCAVFVPLTILTGRYFMWRRWDRERREQRLARRQGLAIYYARTGHVEAAKPGFSVKV